MPSATALAVLAACVAGVASGQISIKDEATSEFRHTTVCVFNESNPAAVDFTWCMRYDESAGTGVVDAADARPTSDTANKHLYRWNVYLSGKDALFEHHYTGKGIQMSNEKWHDFEAVEMTAVDDAASLGFVIDESAKISPRGPYRFMRNITNARGVVKTKCLALDPKSHTVDVERVHFNDCDHETTLLTLRNYHTWRPTPAPVTVTSAPSVTAPPHAPSAGDPGQWREQVIVLAAEEHAGVSEGLWLGLGISTGDDGQPEAGDKLQLKSLHKTQNKGDLHANKMLWDLDSSHRLHPSSAGGSSSSLVLQSNKWPNALKLNALDTSGILVLKEETNSPPSALNVFTEVPYPNVFSETMHIVLTRTIGATRGEMCVTAASCDPWDVEKCRWRSNFVGCENSCHTGVCPEVDADGEAIPGTGGTNAEKELCGKMRQGIVNGSYVKLARCNPVFDESQVFKRGHPEEFLIDVPVAPAPTPNPTQEPIVAPTAEPTTANNNNNNGAPTPETRAAEDDSSGRPGLWVLSILLFLALLWLLVVLTRRRRRKRAEVRERNSAFFDDDDDQDKFSSFETDKLNGSGLNEPIGGDATSGAAVHSDNESTTNSVQQRMVNRRRGSSMSFEPHVAHFEQETGFVSRV